MSRTTATMTGQSRNYLAAQHWLTLRPVCIGTSHGPFVPLSILCSAGVPLSWKSNGRRAATPGPLATGTPRSRQAPAARAYSLAGGFQAFPSESSQRAEPRNKPQSQRDWPVTTSACCLLACTVLFICVTSTAAHYLTSWPFLASLSPLPFNVHTPPGLNLSTVHHQLDSLDSRCVVLLSLSALLSLSLSLSHTNRPTVGCP